MVKPSDTFFEIDAEPMFDRSGSDLGGEAQEPVRPAHAPAPPESGGSDFLGTDREIELEPEPAGDDDDRVLGDD